MIFNVIVFRTVTEVHGFYGSSLSFLSKMVLLLFRTSFLFCIPSAKFICPPLVIPDVLICVWTLMLPDDRFHRSLLLLYFQFGTLVPLFGSLCSLQVLLLFDLFFGGGFFRSYDIAHGDTGFAVNCHRSPWQYGHENNLWQANRNCIKAASLSLTECCLIFCAWITIKSETYNLPAYPPTTLAENIRVTEHSSWEGPEK